MAPGTNPDADKAVDTVTSTACPERVVLTTVAMTWYDADTMRRFLVLVDNSPASRPQKCSLSSSVVLGLSDGAVRRQHCWQVDTRQNNSRWVPHWSPHHALLCTVVYCRRCVFRHIHDHTYDSCCVRNNLALCVGSGVVVDAMLL